MDRKSLIVLGLSFLLILGWFELVKVLYPPPPKRAGTNTVATATNRVALPEAATNRSIPQLATAPLTATAWAAPKSREELLTFETPEVRYTFTSHGGGLKQVELRGYREIVGTKKITDTNRVVTLNTRAPVAAMTILGGEAVQGDGLFQMARLVDGVRMEKFLPNGLRIVKDFKPTTNHLMEVTVWLENTTPQPLTLPPQEWVFGTATPINAIDPGDLLNFDWYDGASFTRTGEMWFKNATLGCFPGTPRTEFMAGNSNVVWAAVQNQFFAIAAIPQQPALRVFARHIKLPPHPLEEVPAGQKPVLHPVGFQAAFIYDGHTLEPGGANALERRFTFFTGPKEYHYLARLGQQMGNSLDLIMDFGGFFGFFAKALLLSLNGLHTTGLPYAWCIILITVIIKIIFWPLTAVSTKSMKRMAELQPQMKALQEKYKDDPKKMNQKLMEFMRENKCSPMAGCLPMLVQIPVFFGFFTMLRSAIELRGVPFLWANDLSQPDTVGYILGYPFNPLPLIMAATMLWQARLTPPSPSMDPMQQKIMKYMPLMFVIFLYHFSAALTLYWTVQNLLTILQTKLTNTKPKPAAPAPVVAPKKKK